MMRMKENLQRMNRLKKMMMMKKKILLKSMIYDTMILDFNTDNYT